MMLVSSKTVPLLVHTGCEYGCSESEQKLKGSRLNGTAVFARKLCVAP
jgi:hypothetical protein